jgi:hypothetical protein
MKFSTKVAKKRAKKIGAWLEKKGQAIDKYREEAPQRRTAEITRLKQEIQIAKLKRQKAALQPKMDYGESMMGGIIGKPNKKKQKAWYL